MLITSSAGLFLIVIWQQLLSDHILILPMSGSFENAVFAERIVSDQVTTLTINFEPIKESDN